MKLTWVDSLCFTRVQLPLFQTTAISARANACSLSLQSTTFFFFQDRQNHSLFSDHIANVMSFGELCGREAQNYSANSFCGCVGAPLASLCYSNTPRREWFTALGLFPSLSSPHRAENCLPRIHRKTYFSCEPHFLFYFKCAAVSKSFIFFYTEAYTLHLYCVEKFYFLFRTRLNYHLTYQWAARLKW